jgi:hypothetical protein
MKKYLFITLLFIAALLIACESGYDKLGNDPTLYELEKIVRNCEDHKATHRFEQYEELLQELSKDKYLVVPIHRFIDSLDDERVVVALRHDVDWHPFKALEMAFLEENYGIRSSWYILATAPYYGKYKRQQAIRFESMNSVYRELHEQGHEVGIHNDLIALMVKYDIEPLEFTRNEMAFFDSLGIPVYGCVAHGSGIAQNTVPNFHIFSDWAESDFIEYKGKQYPIGSYSLDHYGFEYEANFINHTQYFSESSGTWNIEGGFYAVLNQIRQSEPGDRIQILTHPVWWGKN